MAYSINVPAVKVMALEGPPLVIRYARLMGIDPNTPLDPVLSLALGSNGVTPLEMASVYGTIADGGNHADADLPDARGGPDQDAFPPVVETQVLQKSTVTQVDDMLRAVVTDPRGTGAVVADVPDARGKTGTTQGHKDVWFIGYTPELGLRGLGRPPDLPAAAGRDDEVRVRRGDGGQRLGGDRLRADLEGLHAQRRADLPEGEGP